jgi:hypothetical protein
MIVFLHGSLLWGNKLVQSPRFRSATLGQNRSQFCDPFAPHRYVLNDVVAVIRPQVDAKAKCVRVAHRHLSFPQSSSASRFTAGAAGFFILSQSVVRPDR